MTERALLMAGGRSTRMRATGEPCHKAMVEIGGVSLIERNIRQLIAFDMRDIVVVVSSAEHALRHYVDRRIVPLVRAASGSIEVCSEPTPLGNIGFAATLEGARDVVVTYVDNLTTLDARALLAHHRSNEYDLTLAVHDESVTFPYGVLEVRDGFVTSYDEKPTRRATVSSGTCVLGARARRLMPTGRRLDARDLFGLVRAAGGSIGAYRHSAPWVDVNDADAIRRAEELVRVHEALDARRVAS